MKATKNDLKNIILELISTEQEGGYWDFKREWHKNKADLLLDIICLANNLEDRDAYLIFGVDDKTHKIIGVKKDDKNKINNTNELINFLRDRKFVGGVRPTVRMEDLDLGQGRNVTVLIIENSSNVPFMLQEDYSFETSKPNKKSYKKTICAGKIYTRVQDQNTPNDRAADIDKQEKLWRKRFGIDKNPHEKVLKYLDTPEHWERIDRDYSDRYVSNDDLKYPNLEMVRPYCDKFYYKYAPEFTIERVDRSSGFRNFINLSFPNPNSTIEDVVVKVHDIVIFQSWFSYYDGARATLISPPEDFIKISNKKVFWMYYIIKDSFEDKINNLFITDKGENYFDYRLKVWKERHIFFDSDEEKIEFMDYISNKYTENIYDEAMKRIKDKISYRETAGVSDNDLHLYQQQYKSMVILKEEFKKWKNKG